MSALPYFSIANLSKESGDRIKENHANKSHTNGKLLHPSLVIFKHAN